MSTPAVIPCQVRLRPRWPLSRTWSKVKDPVLAGAAGWTVVTDTNGAHAQGSMISFRLAKDRVRFEVSVDAADKSGLKLSARMLSIALPGMPGVDLAQAAIRSHQNLKVVFSSGYGAVSKHQFAHPFSTLSKPFTLKKLQRTLEEVAGVQSA